MRREWMYGRIWMNNVDNIIDQIKFAEFDENGDVLPYEELDSGCETDDEFCSDGLDEYFIGLGYTENGATMFSWACIEDLVTDPYAEDEE